MNSDHGQHGGHPLVEILPKAKCEDVKDYNHKGTLDRLYLAKSIEQSALQSSQPSKVVSATQSNIQSAVRAKERRATVTSVPKISQGEVNLTPLDASYA